MEELEDVARKDRGAGSECIGQFRMTELLTKKKVELSIYNSLYILYVSIIYIYKFNPSSNLSSDLSIV